MTTRRAPDTAFDFVRQLLDDEGMTGVRLAELLGQTDHGVQVSRYRKREQVPSGPNVMRNLWKLAKERDFNLDEFRQMMINTFIERALHDADEALEGAQLET